MFGCSVPFSLWVGCLFVATLSYYTTDYMRQGQEGADKRTERYVYDPTAGALSCTQLTATADAFQVRACQDRPAWQAPSTRLLQSDLCAGPLFELADDGKASITQVLLGLCI